MLETKRVKGIVKLGDNCNNEMIMSHKQGESYSSSRNEYFRISLSLALFLSF